MWLLNGCAGFVFAMQPFDGPEQRQYDGDADWEEQRDVDGKPEIYKITPLKTG